MGTRSGLVTRADHSGAQAFVGAADDFLPEGDRRYHQPPVDGYTVEEAASVLGVPRERVWELLARGVLSGAPDLAGGMRVRLKAEAPPEPRVVEPGPDAAPPSTGEVSPFRELLTEFRSLTERYGQALLALGEARGEVAGLRSRVDMLEARIDLRLPLAASPPLSSGWGAAPWPAPSERVLESHAPQRAAPATEPEELDAEELPLPRRRGRGGRRATKSFADALARAEDPSPPDLPGASEAAAALGALRRDQMADADLDASLPRELPSADPVPVAEELADVAEPASAPAAQPAEQEAPAADEAEPAGESPAAVTEPAWDRARYSNEIEDPGWMVADEDAAAVEDATPPTAPDESAESAPAAEPEPEAEVDPLPAGSSGSRELDEGLAALDALANPPEPAPGTAVPPADAPPAETSTPPTIRPWTPSPSPPTVHAPVVTRSPASRAYRRLRRIFPA